MPGTLFVVATPIGNLEDITARALRVLREVSVIAAEDTRRTAHLLARYAISTPTISLHEHNEAAKSPALVGRLLRGDNIALVSDAGTPTISDPGRTFIREAVAAGIRVEAIPGPSAVMTALAASGLSTESFTFLGFPPPRSKDRKLWFERARQIGGTLVFFEAPHRITRTLQELQALVGDLPVVICRELTKVHEELVRGPISEALSRVGDPRGEFTVVIEIGEMTESREVEAPRAQDIAEEFGRMIKSGGASRRSAVAELAARYRMGTNEVYRALEKAKSSVE
jgi:16S rRNA (cytidine1402-2'-O)-methyltransferase